MLPRHLFSTEDPNSLEVVSRVYGEEVERRRKEGQEAQGLELIRDIAAFKARAQYLVKKRYAVLDERKQSGQEKSFLLSGVYLDVQNFETQEPPSPAESTSVSLAIDKRVQKARYIVG